MEHCSHKLDDEYNERRERLINKLIDEIWNHIIDAYVKATVSERSKEFPSSGNGSKPREFESRPWHQEMYFVVSFL
jgi:hypothetical protein